MQLPQLYKQIGAWLEGTGPEADVVISSRIRLARNIAGFNFLPRADAQQQRELLHFVRDKIMATKLKDRLWYVEMNATEPLEKQIMVERHLISKELSEGNGFRAVALTPDEELALVFNQEDHLRIQAINPALRLGES